MPHVITWCGFLGAWLLVAGPLDQAVREIAETEVLDQAKEKVEEPPPVSRWWILLPPVWYLLRGAARRSTATRSARRCPTRICSLGVVGMLVLCIGTTINRSRHRRSRAAVLD